MSLAAELPRRPWTTALVGPVACGCCLAGAAVYITVQDPTLGGVFLPCPFRLATGLWCPGCGLTRATHFLFRGDLPTALRYNLFVVPILLAIVAGWAAWTMRAAGRPPRERHLPRWAVAALITVAAGFALVRNLPGVDGLSG
jgi:Protein of unknown function (DUF2752)